MNIIYKSQYGCETLNYSDQKVIFTCLFDIKRTIECFDTSCVQQSHGPSVLLQPCSKQSSCPLLGTKKLTSSYYPKRQTVFRVWRQNWGGAPAGTGTKR